MFFRSKKSLRAGIFTVVFTHRDKSGKYFSRIFSPRNIYALTDSFITRNKSGKRTQIFNGGQVLNQLDNQLRWNVSNKYNNLTVLQENIFF